MPRVRAEPVRFLALEGGGGKGLLYPGVLMGLAHKGLLVYTRAGGGALEHAPRRLAIEGGEAGEGGRIRSVSGASAGAITALLLTCGYTPSEVLLIMGLQDKTAFFDISDTTFPQPFGAQSIDTHRDIHDQLYQRSGRIEAWVQAIQAFLISLSSGGGPAMTEALIGLIHVLQDQAPPALMVAASRLAGAHFLPVAAVNAIQSHPREAARSLAMHYGIFAGTELRRFLNRWVTIARWRIRSDGAQEWHELFEEHLEAQAGEDDEALTRVRASRHVLTHFSTEYDRIISVQAAHGARDQSFKALRNTTFEQHYNEFRVPLYVTGSNIERGVTEFLSPVTTPNFPIADGVRISLSLPGVFKPLVLRQGLVGLGDPEQHILPGVWMDGGYFNNLPLYAFDLESGNDNIRHVLGLRIDQQQNPLVKPARIAGLDGFLTAWATLGLFGAGESQVSETVGKNAQKLAFNAGDLSTFDFDPEPSHIVAATRAARSYVEDHLTSIEVADGDWLANESAVFNTILDNWTSLFPSR